MSKKVNHFLTPDQEKEVIEAIQLAELQTSGEIRVHLEKSSKGDAIKRATEVFKKLKMDQTALRNAVLIYLAVEEKTFTIYGDKGIHELVGLDFWNSTKDIMQTYFMKGAFKEGLIAGIQKSGEELKTYFPYSDTDTNELSNEISNG